MSADSKLADVLQYLNRDLTRHRAYARATRILNAAASMSWRGGTLDDGPSYAGKLFASAVLGLKRVR